MKYLLDTHTWIWRNMRPQNLSQKITNLIQRTEAYDELLLSSISPWEFGKLLEKGKLGISYDPKEWIYTALEMPKLRVVPLTPLIAYHSTTLPRPSQDDPADQIIVATAREENAAILTKDKINLNYQHVQSLW